MTIIIFCGPDGAGKSTQVKLLIQYLRDRGLRTKSSWIRALHFFALFLARIMIAFGLYRIVSNPLGGSYKLPDLKRIRPIRELWPYVELFSMLPLLFFRATLPSILGWTVISERLTPDTIAALAWQLEDRNFPNGRLARILLGFSRNSLLINLDSDYETILKRRMETAEPKNFIEIQRQVYFDLSKKIPMLTIDTSKYNITETQIKIREYVLPKIAKSRESTHFVL